MKILRALAAMGVVLLLVAAAAGFYLLGREAVPATSDYVIDRAALERAAHSLPGELPVRISHVKIAEATMPRAALFSGIDFSPHRMVHGAYQVVYPDGSYALIDAGFGAVVFEGIEARGPARYFPEAFEALKSALADARIVVMTHEHADHIEGLAEVDDAAALAGRVFMPAAQYENPQTRKLLPETLMRAMAPTQIQGARAIAPGIAVLPAAGHTPGSQLVYVRTQDVAGDGGRAFLFIGDVAWHMEQLRELQYRPRLITEYFLGEDRAAVMAQFRTLHGMLNDPSLQIVSSHDPDQLRALQRDGVLGEGLERAP